MRMILKEFATWMYLFAVGMFLIANIWYGIYLGVLDHSWLRRACDIIYGDGS